MGRTKGREPVNFIAVDAKIGRGVLLVAFSSVVVVGPIGTERRTGRDLTSYESYSIGRWITRG